MERRSTSLGNSPSISRRQRRRSIQGSFLNATLWGLGNGLVSSTLVIYLAKELGAGAVVLGVAWILAFPKFVGLLRLSAPAMIDRLASRKTFCITCYAASACVLFSLPLVSAPGFLSTPEWSLAALVTIWSLYHLLEYIGTVALWSWLADLVPRQVRGRFIGVREHIFPDGSTWKEEMIDNGSVPGRRFEAKDGSSSGDYYLIDDSGRLQVWDKQGQVYSARRID